MTIFTVTLHQFDVSLWNKSINFFKKKNTFDGFMFSADNNSPKKTQTMFIPCVTLRSLVSGFEDAF